jgi:hypothetical protein
MICPTKHLCDGSREKITCNKIINVRDLFQGFKTVMAQAHNDGPSAAERRNTKTRYSIILGDKWASCEQCDLAGMSWYVGIASCEGTGLSGR